MYPMNVTVGRNEFTLSDHARERFYDRTGAATRQDLERALEKSHFVKGLPRWFSVNQWHRARAFGWLALTEDTGFSISKNADGSLVATTFDKKEPVS